MNFVLIGINTLIILKKSLELLLEKLNLAYLQKTTLIPNSKKKTKDHLNIEKKTKLYTKVKSNFYQLEIVFDMVVLMILLNSGFLGIYYQFFFESGPIKNDAPWLNAAFVFAFFMMYQIIGMPFEIYKTFKIEGTFGFNQTTLFLWIKDKLKGFFLSVILMYPLLIGVMSLLNALEAYWWVFAFILVCLFQFILQLIFPKIILPLFNKLTPLQKGPLKKRLLTLAEKSHFHSKEILAMDGSKRSTHSNAFFTGMGKYKRIVFFDTLLKQLNPSQVEAVLAHEIGHYKKKHLIKSLFVSIFLGFLMFYVLDYLTFHSIFNSSFNLPQGHFASTFIIFILIFQVASFLLSPFINFFSRKNEYEADAFATKILKTPKALIETLYILSEKNLSNPKPHPFYSLFYYSHPSVLEREKALRTKKNTI